jgi:hypothetical protein
MCPERAALFDEYKRLVQENADRVASLASLGDRIKSDEFEAALIETRVSRQAVEDAFNKLRQHISTHGCTNGNLA